VRLTRQGRAVVDRALETHINNEKKLHEPLDATERRTLDNLLRRLLVELESETDDVGSSGHVQPCLGDRLLEREPRAGPVLGLERRAEARGGTG
jgi:hypothetical protein